MAEPKVEEVKESDAKDKLLAAATASYDFCADALGKMDDSKLGDNIELFGGHKFPVPWRRWAWPADGPTITLPLPVFAVE